MSAELDNSIQVVDVASRRVIALGRGNAIAIIDAATRKTRAVAPVGPRV